VGELGRGHAVADGPHALLAGAAALVDRDEAPLVDLDRVPSRPRSAVAGLRPTDTTTTSVLTGSPPSISTTVPLSPAGGP
jgi:hypothetical protein